MMASPDPMVRWAHPTLPLSSDELASARWAFSDNYLFAADLTAVPIVPTELLRIAHEYPIAFAKLGGAWVPLALLRWPGTARPFSNRFVDGDGRWGASYVPFLVRTYPFTATLDGTNEPSFTVEIVRDPACLAGGHGHPCQTDGTLSQEARSVEQQITQALSSFAGQHFAVQSLEAAGLLRARHDLGMELGSPIHMLDLGARDKFAAQAAYWHRVSPAAVRLAIAGFFSYGRAPGGRPAVPVPVIERAEERPAIAPAPIAQDLSWLDFGDKVAF